MSDIENPMVIDRIWRKKELKVIDECAGCWEDIYEGEDVYEFVNTFGEKALIHQKDECCLQYIAGLSTCKIAGE
jgi:hypothetical protein